MNKSAAFLVLTLPALLALPAFAQDKAATADVVDPYKLTCPAPTIPTGNVTEEMNKAYLASGDTYRGCVLAFTADMRARAEAATKAANAAIAEYNGFLKLATVASEQSRAAAEPPKADQK